MNFPSMLIDSGYTLADKISIFMKPGYAGIAYSDGDETENRIANIIAEAQDLSIFSRELAVQCTDWPSLYHLSGTRANILRPFHSILKQANVLEIGAGCGAITRYLGESGANVLALEGSPRRAVIARSRTRDLENVTIVADKFDQFQCDLDLRFDIITLIGVLEYAALFTDDENPVVSMLTRIRELLKPEGRLILAIENQLGLKYFAGAAEDHTGEPMLGIEGRYSAKGPQTFGRKVLTTMLQQAGFVNQQFMAPFPDYKLPISILTEQGLNCDTFDAAALCWQSVHRDPQLRLPLVFAPELAWPIIEANNLTLDLANSFLVSASVSNDMPLDNSIMAYHYSTNGRHADYCKESLFVLDANNIFVKYNLLSSNDTKSTVENLVQFNIPKESMYIKGEILHLELIRIVTRDGWSIDEVGRFLKKYIKIIKIFAKKNNYTINHVSVDTNVPGSCFDIVPQNIILSDHGKFYIIDQEWTLNKDIKIGWLIFRTLLLLINSISRFSPQNNDIIYTRIEFILAAFHNAGLTVNKNQIKKFWFWEINVQTEIHGYETADPFEWNLELPLNYYNQHELLKEKEENLDFNRNIISMHNEKISNLELFIENQHKDIIELNDIIDKNKNIIDKYERESELLKNIQKNLLAALDKINNIESSSSYNLQNSIKLNDISKFNFSCSIIKLNKFYKKRTYTKYKEYRLLKKLCQSNNNIFDHDWYIKQYPDIKKIRNPLKHYFMYGAYENRNPNPYFDSTWYIKKYNDVAKNKINPLLHYIQYGWIEGRDPSPYFNTTWYTNQYKDVKENHINPLLHFLNYGDQEGRNPNPYFDAQWYKSSYEEVRLSGIYPFLHYITIGFKERKNPSPYFDTNWYLSVNDDVRESGMDPLLHYMLYGWHEGRDPNPYFDSKWYVKKYPEALVSSCSPLLHYIESGKSNWKNPNKFFDSKWYLATYPEVKKTKTDPLLHFICHGVVEKKNPSPSFDVNWYLEEYQDVKESGLNPLFHYMHYGQHEGRLTKSKIPIRIEINEKSQIGILHTPHTKYLADQIAISLNKLSINSFLLQEKPEEGFNECIHFVLCPQMFLELPKKYIAYQMEQSVNPRWFTSEYYSILDNALAVIDYSTHNIEFLRNNFQLRDNQLYYVPVDYIDINKNLYKNQCESYDVLFYGDPSCERRKLFLENLGKHFNIKIINNTFGEDLYKEISKAKIIINIHYYENALLETTRLWECLSLEKLIVSEKSIDFEEHEDLFNLIDFVDIGDVNSMIKKIKYWLQNDKCRRDYIDKNRNTLTDRVNKFEYFFFRFMLANENISFDYFWRICGKNITLEKEKIVCLTLPEFSERKKIFKENNPVQVHFFDGLRHYKNGWIGCGMSYKLMIKLAKKQNFKNITICEDDVKFLDDFENRFTDIKIGLETTIHPWDIFSGFMSDVSQDIVIKKIIKFGEQEVLIVNKIISMVFNCYNHTSYDSIINWNETNLDVNLNTIDRFLEQQDNLIIFLSFPFLAEHKDDLQSTIWGFNNTQYNHLINRSVRLLQKKVFVKKIVGNSHTM